MEEKLLQQYSGKGTLLPQTLMFDHVSPATRLLEKRRQMFEVQEALNSQEEEFGRREDAFRRREEGLRRKDLELQESLIKFNKFLQENESKRNRAKKRFDDERKQCEIKDTEIRRLQEQLNQKYAEEQALTKQVSQNLKYQEFMDNMVANMAKFFPEVRDILNRHQTLADVSKDLSQKAQEAEVAAERKLREYVAYKKEKENEALNLNNAIAKISVQVEHTMSETNALQLAVDSATLHASEKTLELGQVSSSIANILERCDYSFRVRHNKPPPPASSGEPERVQRLSEMCLRIQSKLDEIEMFMTDYSTFFTLTRAHCFPLPSSASMPFLFL
jgi:myosin heavy subunit